jgi:hypothetical protein
LELDMSDQTARYTNAIVRRAIERYAAEHGDLATIRHTVQITSFGGSGTTALTDHLRAAGVDLPRTPGEIPFKHMRVPPTTDEVPEGFRVLYPFADPRNAVLSVFRRESVVEHYGGLHRGPPPPEVAAALSSLDAFLANGVDVFELEDHVNRWLEPHGYPVLFVRYERLPAVWATVREFLGLETTVPCFEMHQRASAWRALPNDQRLALDGMYRSLVLRLDALPDAFEIAPP